MNEIAVDPFLSDDPFIPYFVIYRFTGESELQCNTFMTLYELYDFLRSYFDKIKNYRVGRCLESYNI